MPSHAHDPPSHSPAIAAQPFVDGFLVRVPWADLEPAPGVHDWSLIEQQVALIAGDGKRVALGVVQGDSGTPDWLPGLGAQMVTYSFAGGPRTIAVPWDPVYLARWTDFVAALGARFGDEPAIELVHATHATHNGFEMQLPFGEEAQYLALGYTDSLYAGSWATVLDAFAAAFPDRWLDVDVHPIWGSDQVAEDVVAHGLAAVGPRFGAFGAWWSEHNALEVYTGMHALFLDTAPQSWTTVQNVGSWITTPERYDFDLAEYEASYALALDAGVRYFEVWNQDLLSAALAPFLLDTSAAVHCPGWSMHYGSGTPGSGGFAPALDVTGCPSPGDTATLSLAGGLGGAQGWIGVGSEREALPLLGGTLLIGPLSGVALLPIQLAGSGPGAGTWTADWNVGPGVPPVITAQAMLLDAGAGAGVALSNALELRPQ